MAYQVIGRRIRIYTTYWVCDTCGAFCGYISHTIKVRIHRDAWCKDCDGVKRQSSNGD